MKVKRVYGILVGALWLLLVPVIGMAAAEGKTLVVLGDSLSAGYGLKQGTGWVALFERRLAERGIALQVVNESISGEVTAGGLARLPGIIERVEPDMLVIELGGNDGLRGLSPKVMEKNLGKMVAMAEAKGIEVFLFGMKLPPNYGAAYNRLFEGAFTKVAEEYGVPLLPFFLDGVGGYLEMMQADGIHPNQGAQGRLMENAWGFLEGYLRD